MKERYAEESLPEGWEEYPSSRSPAGRVIFRLTEDSCIGYVQNDFLKGSQGYVYPEAPIPGSEIKVGFRGSLEDAMAAVEAHIGQILIPHAEVLRQARAYDVAKAPED